MKKPSLRDTSSLAQGSNPYSQLAGSAEREEEKPAVVRATQSFNVSVEAVDKIRAVGIERGARSLSEMMDVVMQEWIEAEEARRGEPIKPLPKPKGLR